MLNLIIDQLKETAMSLEWDEEDWGYYSYCIGKASGMAAATGTVGVLAPLLCDDLSDVYELCPATEIVQYYEGCVINEEECRLAYAAEFEVWHILDEIMKRSDDEDSSATAVESPDIGWAEYGAALNEAVRAKEDGDELRFELMMGFVSGLMFNNPGPSHPEHGTILDAINTAYVDRSDTALQYARARIASGVRMTDPSPFMGKEQYDRYMAEKLETLRRVQNFGLHHARSGDETVAVPGSMAINHAVRQMTSHEQAENPPRPIEMCYWVVPGKLLAGEYPRNLDETSSREKLAKLTDAGVSVFIDLTNPETTDGHLKPYAYLLDGQTHERFPIDDQDVPASVELTKAALDAIDGHLAAGRTVYVHCWGGVGRTGTIIGCWLARRHEPGQAALDRLKELWLENPKSKQGRRSPETNEQKRYVREWYEGSLSAEQIRKRDARIANESSGNFADLPEDVKDWYRQVAMARVKAHETGDFSELIVLGDWPSEEEAERGE